MRILHLSDIHLTGQFKNFSQIWSGPSAYCKQGTFDFIVISGDLSQCAQPKEYEELEAFLDRSVLPLLIRQQRERIILVPGNHDVDWSVPIGTQLALGHELESDPRFAEKLRHAMIQPEESTLRTRLSTHGHLEIFQIDPERYLQRFANIQAFLDRFHGKSTSVRRFNLTSEEDGEHWSAHIFQEEGVAFYGFNSCHQNDRYWTGAMISAKAVEQARLHADLHAGGLIRVAVWHHGLDTGRGRPDYLSVQDIGLLYNAGFRIGFHGHTHKAAHKTFDALFNNSFFIVSTGSLGAGSEERPDAVGNQFSIAQIYPGHVDVEVFTRDGSSTSYERNRERKRFLLTQASMPRLDQLSHAAHHHRSWVLREDGIARVEIKLSDVTLRGEMTLALVEPPFVNVRPDEEARSPRGTRSVEHKELPDGRIRFTVTAAGHEERLEWLHWSYYISNSLALNGADLKARRDRPAALEPLQPELDGRPHTVRFPCDEIALELVLPEGVHPPEVVQRLALQRAEERGQERWKIDAAESRRVQGSTEGNRLKLSVSSPLEGHRYVVAYEPRSPGPQYDPELNNLLSWLLEQCRDRVATEDSLPATLTEALDEALGRVLSSPTISTKSAWAGYLWHPKRRSLMTAFGKIPNRGWSVRFGWGEGVAGHALRFARAASWSRGGSSDQSLIYRSKPKASTEGDYSWIVCIPILTAPRGPAVGVLGFAGDQCMVPAEHQLREYAEIVSQQPDETAALKLRDRLFAAIQSSFWQVLRSWDGDGMTARKRERVEQICHAFELPPMPIPPG